MSMLACQKHKVELAQLDKDDKKVFATSLLDRYAARPHSLQNMCLATFVVSYDVVSSAAECNKSNVNTDEDMQEDMPMISKLTMLTVINSQKLSYRMDLVI